MFNWPRHPLLRILRRGTLQSFNKLLVAIVYLFFNFAVVDWVEWILNYLVLIVDAGSGSKHTIDKHRIMGIDISLPFCIDEHFYQIFADEPWAWSQERNIFWVQRCLVGISCSWENPYASSGLTFSIWDQERDWRLWYSTLCLLTAILYIDIIN